MVPSYVPLETIQLLSETSFSKIKNKKVIWGGTLKWDGLYTGCPRLDESAVNGRFLRSFGDENSNTKMLRNSKCPYY